MFVLWKDIDIIFWNESFTRSVLPSIPVAPWNDTFTPSFICIIVDLRSLQITGGRAALTPLTRPDKLHGSVTLHPLCNMKSNLIGCQTALWHLLWALLVHEVLAAPSHLWPPVGWQLHISATYWGTCGLDKTWFALNYILCETGIR